MPAEAYVGAAIRHCVSLCVTVRHYALATVLAAMLTPRPSEETDGLCL